MVKHSALFAKDVLDRNCSSVKVVQDRDGGICHRLNRTARNEKTARLAMDGEMWNASSAETVAMGWESLVARLASDEVGHLPTLLMANGKLAFPAEEAAQKHATNAAALDASTAAAATAWDILKSKGNLFYCIQNPKWIL
ncbi:MAG: hypothetical protein K2M50_01155 [Treponemataceae bacterium]|nr:hypothetical protein [Treponemataceae bacterium]